MRFAQMPLHTDLILILPSFAVASGQTPWILTLSKLVLDNACRITEWPVAALRTRYCLALSSTGPSLDRLTVRRNVIGQLAYAELA